VVALALKDKRGGGPKEKPGFFFRLARKIFRLAGRMFPPAYFFFRLARKIFPPARRRFLRPRSFLFIAMESKPFSARENPFAKASNFFPMVSRSSWIFGVSVLVAALAWPLPMGAQPLSDRLPLAGTVVDETGSPVAAAVLRVRKQDDTGPSSFWGGEARTDEKGHFEFPTAQEGRYFVSIEAPAHAALQNSPLNWNAGSPALRLVVKRLTRVVLHLRAPDGSVLMGAPLWVRSRTAEGDTVTARVSSDGNGDAVLPDAAPGTYSVVIVAQSGVAALPNVPVAWAKDGVRVEVPLSVGATIRVHALDANKKPLGGASLVLFPRSPEDAATLAGVGADAGENWALLAAANVPQALVTRDGDGVLELSGIPAGHFSARLSLPGYGSPTRDFDARDGQTLDWDVSLPARRAASLSLLVRDGAGQIVKSAPVALRMLPLAADGSFAPDSPFGDIAPPAPNGANAPPDLPFFTTGPGGRVARTDEAGQITLYPLKAGRYRVFASRPTPETRLRAPFAVEGAPVDVEVSIAPKEIKAVEIRVP